MSLTSVYIYNYKQERETFKNGLLRTVFCQKPHLQSVLIFFNFDPSVSPFAFAELLKCSFYGLRSYLYISLNFVNSYQIWLNVANACSCTTTNFCSVPQQGETPFRNQQFLYRKTILGGVSQLGADKSQDPMDI